MPRENIYEDVVRILDNDIMKGGRKRDKKSKKNRKNKNRKTQHKYKTKRI